MFKTNKLINFETPFLNGLKKGGAYRYRYGFNGKENDNEVKGTGNQIDYGARIYDGRLGRFLSVENSSVSMASFANQSG